jgi:hypothetical protein
LAKKLKLKKLTSISGIQYELLALDEDGMVYHCDNDSHPTYAVSEQSYQPVYINDEENFCVALDYVIIYPFVYVKKSRLKEPEEIIANIHLH